jgi:hypothetical protein
VDNHPPPPAVQKPIIRIGTCRLPSGKWFACCECHPTRVFLARHQATAFGLAYLWHAQQSPSVQGLAVPILTSLPQPPAGGVT